MSSGTPYILVVEDDEPIAMLERISLERRGFRVRVAANGRRALEHLEELENIALMVLDYRLPDMTGADIVASLGRSIASLPVVMVTGYPDPVLETQMREAGIYDYIVKDVGLKFLQSMASVAQAALDGLATGRPLVEPIPEPVEGGRSGKEL